MKTAAQIQYLGLGFQLTNPKFLAGCEFPDFPSHPLSTPHRTLCSTQRPPFPGRDPAAQAVAQCGAPLAVGDDGGRRGIEAG